MTFDLEEAVSIATRNHNADEWKKYQEEQLEKLKSSLGDQDMQARIQFGQRLIEYGETLDAKAEGYYLAGMIETAIQLTTDELKRTEYQNALEALSSHKCECRKDGFVTERIVYNGQVYSLIKCPNCGALTTQ